MIEEVDQDKFFVVVVIALSILFCFVFVCAFQKEKVTAS